ncbi:MAG TPA: hypothetical protein VHU15_15360 [Stellaceae bacterium]|jgi:hypothetical protein|nr:hypothetical protein [Stellaceae bacterium]
MQYVTYLLARFSEPSSYAGLGAVIALIGWHLSDTGLGALAQFLAAGCALAALLLKERGTVAALLLCLALVPTLGACGALVPAGSALGAIGGGITIANQVSAAIDPVIAAACAEYARGAATANAMIATGLMPASVTAKVTSIESFGDAACAQPPSGDALSTAIWLGRLAGQVTTLTGTAAPGG